MIDELPPPLANVDAEQVVLGVMMTNTDNAVAIADGLRSSSFYKPAHGIIFDTILDAAVAEEPVDPVAIAERLAESGDLQRTGGAPYLHTLVSAVPVVHNGPWFARIVAEYATRRGMVDAYTRAAQVAGDVSRDLPEAVAIAQKLTQDAALNGRRSTTVTAADLLDQTISEVLDPNGNSRGLSTGLGSLDDAIGGLKPGQLTLIAARPGAGKTVLALNIAWAIARHRIPTLFCSLEMSASELERRILAAVCTINVTRVMNGNLRPHEIQLLRERSEVIRNATLHIDDSSTMDVTTIGTVARRIQQNYGLGAVVVDYIQLMSAAGKHHSRTEEVGSISRGLKVLAKDLGVPVIAAAQVNRSADSRSDKRPALSDLRESGSLEQDSDAVILLHRDDYYDPEHHRAGEIDLILAKNRGGPMETITASAQLEFARIVDFNIPED